MEQLSWYEGLLSSARVSCSLGVEVQTDDHTVVSGGINLRGQLTPVYGLPGKIVSPVGGEHWHLEGSSC